jgi:hypothetical protein
MIWKKTQKTMKVIIIYSFMGYIFLSSTESIDFHDFFILTQFPLLRRRVASIHISLSPQIDSL